MIIKLYISSGCTPGVIPEAEEDPRQLAISGSLQGSFGEAEGRKEKTKGMSEPDRVQRRKGCRESKRAVEDKEDRVPILPSSDLGFSSVFAFAPAATLHNTVAFNSGSQARHIYRKKTWSRDSATFAG